MRTDRLQTLADGVFAIALTLLVLSLPIPKGSSNLARDLANQWPFYVAYVVSFVTVAIVWINHQALMDGVRRADRTLMELTLLLLMFVAVVPWPTGLLAQYLRSSDQSSPAAVTYGIVMLLMASSFTAIWLWLARADKLAHPELRPRIPHAIRRSLAGPAIYVTGTAVAFVNAPTAFGLFAFAAFFFAFSGRASRVSDAEGDRRASRSAAEVPR